MADSAPSVRIGVDLGGTKTEAIVLDSAGTELARERVPTTAGDYAGTIRGIRDLVDALERSLRVQGTVGVGIPGTISPASGVVKNANSTWCLGKPLDRDLSTALGREVRTANDANCLALSEATDGAGAGESLVFAVILGTGVGGGIAVNGQVRTGPHAIAGEWGHNPLPWPGADEQSRRCYCGKLGCIETYLCGPGLALSYRERSGKAGISAEQVIEQMRAGEPDAMDTWQQYVDRLARALTTVVNVLDPDVIVLGGGLSNIDELYTGLPAALPEYVFSDVCQTRISRAHHGDSSGVRGAAWLWPEHTPASSG